MKSMLQVSKQLGRRAILWLRQPADISASARQLRNRAGAERFSKSLRYAETVLWIVAAVSIGYCSVAYAGAAIHQHRQKALLNISRIRNGLSPATPTASGDPPGPSLSLASVAATSDTLGYGVLGTLEIPRLNVSSIVEEGVDSSTLWEAVGHIPDTALPGHSGNAVLASHRDSYFRGLADVQVGDLIVFKSPTANFRYRVESTRIVDADATDALPDSTVPVLSLVTCYPFNYIGPAPQRFIVTARAETPTTPSGN
jgi:LPXTG-site transpeptidase (sortase) family protein